MIIGGVSLYVGIVQTTRVSFLVRRSILKNLRYSMFVVKYVNDSFQSTITSEHMLKFIIKRYIFLFCVEIYMPNARKNL